MRASAESSRMTISLRLISSENTALVRPCLTEQERAKSRPSVDFPRPGRAATTIIWPGGLETNLSKVAAGAGIAW